MKRNWDTIRRILLDVEESHSSLRSHEIAKDVPTRIVNYHVQLLIDSGFLRCFEVESMTFIAGMSWAGHDLLDQIRDKNP